MAVQVANVHGVSATCGATEVTEELYLYFAQHKSGIRCV